MANIGAGVTALAVAAGAASAAARIVPLHYPPADRGAVVDDYFGTRVADPYRWLEDIDAPQTRTWLNAESALTRAYLDAIPERDVLRARLQALYDYQRVSVPSHEGPTYVFSQNSGLQNQAVLYVRNGPDGTPRVLIDPNALSADGTVALGGGSLSRDGRLYAYATQEQGSDWMTWHVRDVETLQDGLDTIRWAKFSGATWAVDGSGFYYAAFDPGGDAAKLNIVNHDQKLYFHRLGTPQSADELVYARPDHPDWFIGADITEDGRYMILYTSKGSRNGVLYRDLHDPAAKPVELFPNEVAQYGVIDNDGPVFYVRTNEDAPNAKVIAVDVRQPGTRRTIVPEGSDALDGVSAVGGHFFLSYLHDAHTTVREVARDGTLVREVALPGLGTAGGFGGHAQDRSTYYAFTSYTVPTTIYRYDLATGTSTVWHASKLEFDPTRFTTEQIFATSKDGTRIPVSISYMKGLRRDGSAPTILNGYGGFNIPVTPGFSPATILWLELGGVAAVANLRGGSEYGEAWHQAGMLDKKQNVFDDFFAAAQALVDGGYTSAPKLAISGGSNGGLLVAAAMTQHPERFGAVVASVGVLDMLRYQLFTVGRAWVPEYGDAQASEHEFATLYAYSPLHRLRAGVHYPATLIVTGDHDDRVFPAHSFKFAAELQHDQAGMAPVLLLVDLKSGHGGGKPLSKALDNVADQYAFLLENLGARTGQR